MSSRYIKIARKFFESDEWQRPRKFSEQEAWLDMIFLACYADYNLDLGKDGILTLHRGEFYFPQRHLAKRWGWDLTKVNRHLARLAEGDNPRIAKISRETHFETPSETQVATKVVVVRLCNYESYNSVKNKSETPSETRSETPSETLKNKEYLRRKIDNKTHTQYLELKDLFVRSCVSATREDHEIAAKVAQDMASITMTDGEAAQDHNSRCRKDASFNLLFWLWWKFPKLQLSFDRPLNPTEAKDLLAHYKLDDIGVWIESIENKRDSIPYNRSLYSTIKQWAKNDYSLKQKQ